MIIRAPPARVCSAGGVLPRSSEADPHHQTKWRPTFVGERPTREFGVHLPTPRPEPGPTALCETDGLDPGVRSGRCCSGFPCTACSVMPRQFRRPTSNSLSWTELPTVPTYLRPLARRRTRAARTNERGGAASRSGGSSSTSPAGSSDTSWRPSGRTRETNEVP